MRPSFSFSIRRPPAGSVRSAVATQVLGTLTQIATALEIVRAQAAQSLNTLGQNAAVTHPVRASAAQTLSALAQSAAVAHPSGSDDAIQTGGAIDSAKYAAMAANYWNDAMIQYRFGQPAPSSPTGTTYYARTQIAYPVTGPPDNNPNGRPANLPYSGTYGQNLGIWQDFTGGFSSNTAAGAYVADNPTTVIGVYNIEHSDVSNGMLSVRPELSWTRYGGGDEAVEIDNPWRDAGYPTYKATAGERGQGRPGWGCQALFVFQPDPNHPTHPNRAFACTSGANTMANRMGFWLPAGLVCTANTVTNSGEFAIFSCWDPVNVKGVLVFAVLTSLGDGASLTNPDPYWNNYNETSWGEPRYPMPGIPGISNFVYGKVLGTVDLPSSMKAPTAISCTTSHDRAGYMPAGPANVGCWADATKLAVQTNTPTTNGFVLLDRTQWSAPTGFYSNRVSFSGKCIVVSRTEKMGVVVDLTPLFLYYRDMYFNSSNAVFAETYSVGDGANQWPYPFAHTPSQTPTVGTPFSFGAEVPVCVHAIPWGHDNFLVGTVSGKVMKYTLAGSLVTSYTIGSNITSIRQMKEKAAGINGWNSVNTVFVVSRGTREVKAMRLTDGVVLQSLLPVVGQCQDPIAAEDGDNNTADTYCLSVASYTNKRVEGFMYGPFQRRSTVSPSDFNTFGPGPTGSDVAEYAGGYPVLGKPWQVMGANIS